MIHSSGRSLALACAAASAAVALPAKAQDNADVASLRGEVADLKATVEALKAEIAAMRQTGPAPAQAAAAPAAVSAPAAAGVAPGTITALGRTPKAPLETPAAPPAHLDSAQLASAASNLGVTASPLPGRDTIGDRITGASRPNNQSPPNDPDLKGFIPIPGTETAVRIGGFAKVDLIYDPQTAAGNRDEFAVPEIPFGTRGRHRADVSARATRFSLEVRRPSTLGNLRFYVENDFYGDGSGYGFHLNHAYGQVGNTYGGYGYSAMVDADALPDTLDNWGPGGAVFLRTASVRQSFKVATNTHLTVSLEQPDSDLTLGDDQTTAQTMPDVVLVARYEDAKGHLQVGGVVRRIGYRLNDPAEGERGGANATGFALSASGSLSLFGQDSVSLGGTWGKGATHYVNDINGYGLDAAIRPDGSLRLTEHVGGFGAYTHYWTDKVRSNFVFGALSIRDGGLLPSDDFSSSQYGAANVIWAPATSFSVGIEGLWGRLERQDGSSRNASRIQASIKYDFVR